jgi:prolyl-tRNA editing enzyme YbaK/EbsC (Cys-tRNA(Pro) deacylase)
MPGRLQLVGALTEEQVGAPDELVQLVDGTPHAVHVLERFADRAGGFDGRVVDAVRTSYALRVGRGHSRTLTGAPSVASGGVKLGLLDAVPALERTDLLAAPVAEFLQQWPHAGQVHVCEIDPELADTAAFCERYQVGLDVSANCVIVAGRRGEETRYAACVVLATTRADVNGVVRRHLDARKASFAPQDVAVAETGMAYGGITPIGLPPGWPLLVDVAVAAGELLVIGSGTRGSKLAVPGDVLARLPGAQVLDGLGQPVAPRPERGPEPPAAPVVRAPDDTDVGWGERPADPDDADRRYLEDRPPHWGSD